MSKRIAMVGKQQVHVRMRPLVALLGLALSAPLSIQCIHAQQPSASAETMAAQAELRRLPASEIVRRIRALKDLDVSSDPRKYLAEIPPLLAVGRNTPGVSARDLARAKQSLGGAYFNLQQPDVALRYIEEAIADLRADGQGMTPEFAGFLGDRASTLLSTGRVDEGLQASREVAELQKSLVGEDGKEYATALFNVATGLMMQGKLLEAEPLVGQSVRITLAAPDKQKENLASFWLSWSNILLQTGNVERSFQEGRNAADWAERELGGRHAVTGQAHLVLAKTLFNFGRFAEAEQHVRRGLEIQQALLGREHFNTAHYITLLATIQFVQGKFEESASLFKQAMAIIEKHPNPAQMRMEGDVLINAAYVASATGDEAGGFAMKQRAYDLQKQRLPHSDEAVGQAAYELGMAHLLRGDLPKALSYLDEANRVLSATKVKAGRIVLATQLAHGIARYRLGDPSGYAQAEQSVAQMREQLLRQLTSPYEVMRTGRMYALDFALFARFALEAGRADRAFEAMQLAMVGDLDLAGANYLSRRTDLGRGMADIARQLQDAVAQSGKLRVARSSAQSEGKMAFVAEADRALIATDARIAELTAKMDRDFPAYRQLVRPEPESLAAVRTRLAPGDGLLMAVPDRDGVISVLVTREGISHSHTRISQLALSELITRLRSDIDTALLDMDAQVPFDAANAHRLYTVLMPGPVDAAAKRTSRLIVQSAASMAGIPLSALVTSPVKTPRIAGDALRRVDWLIKRQAVESPVSLRMLGAGSAPRASLRFAGIGAPSLSHEPQIAMRGLRRWLRSVDGKAVDVRSLPSLPGASEELRKMGALFSPADALLLTGDQATKRNVQAQDLGSYNVIAFATHGLVSGELRGVTEPGLVMTPPAVGDDPSQSILFASDIADLKLDADWVILSACNTAAGENAGAPMYSGLARAFVHAGARALLLSHWQVRDDVASRLSVETVQASVKGMDRAEALRQAQLRLIRDRSVPGGAHPATWAPFVLIGN